MTSQALQPAHGGKRRFPAIRVISALILREMATRYGRSPGGYLWALLEPLGGILIMSYAFALLVKTPSLGTSFILFFSAAYLPLNMYMTTSGFVQNSISYSKSLLRYPVVSWLDAVLARFLLNALTGSLVACVLMTGIIKFTGTTSVLDIAPMVRASAMALILALGVGTLNCVLIGFFPLWKRVWNIVTRPLMLASGIFYIYEDLPAFGQSILWYNPLIHLTGLFRSGVYATYNPEYVNEAYPLAFGLVCLTIGLTLLRRYNRDLLNR